MLSGNDQTGTDTLTHMRVMFATTNTRQTLGFRSWLVLLVISACDVILSAWQHVSFRRIPQWLFVKWPQVQTAASVWWRYVSTLTICDSVCRSDLMFVKLLLSKNLPAVNRIRKSSKLSRTDDMTPSVCDPAPPHGAQPERESLLWPRSCVRCIYTFLHVSMRLIILSLMFRSFCREQVFRWNFSEARMSW